MSERPHLSPSSINLYSKCGEAFRRRYIEKDIIPPGIAMLRGSGVHSGIEVNFRQKIDSHEDMPADEIVDAAIDGMDARIFKDGYSLTEDEASVGAAKTVGQLRDKVVTLARFHAKEQAPDYQPIAVEERVTIPAPSATHDLMGIIDMVDETGIVSDFKTAKKKKTQDDVDTDIALTFYAAAAKLLFGDHPAMAREVRLDIILDQKTTKRQVITSDRGPADMQVLINRFNSTLSGVAAGTFAPATPGAWWCSPKWCGYWRTCPYVNSERLVKIT